MNPHGCPPDPKSGASAIPPLSHRHGGPLYGIPQYIRIFPPDKRKRARARDAPGTPGCRRSRSRGGERRGWGGSLRGHSLRTARRFPIPGRATPEARRRARRTACRRCRTRGVVAPAEPDDLPGNPDRRPPLREHRGIHAVAGGHQRVVHDMDPVRGDLGGDHRHPQGGEIPRDRVDRRGDPPGILSALYGEDYLGHTGLSLLSSAIPREERHPGAFPLFSSSIRRKPSRINCISSLSIVRFIVVCPWAITKGPSVR